MQTESGCIKTESGHIIIAVNHINNTQHYLLYLFQHRLVKRIETFTDFAGHQASFIVPFLYCIVSVTKNITVPCNKQSITTLRLYLKENTIQLNAVNSNK